LSLKSTFSNSTSKSYALALYELAKENSELTKVEDGMDGIKTLLSKSSDFREMILNHFKIMLGNLLKLLLENNIHKKMWTFVIIFKTNMTM